MTRILVCSVVYEAARPFLADFSRGLIEAAAGRKDAEALILSDGLTAPEAIFAAVTDAMTARIDQTPGGLSPAAIRRRLIETARRSEAEILVFADCDDMLTADALEAHRAALDDADFSYGDQILTDAALRPSGRNLYRDWDVPARVTDPDSLRDGNFVGFSGAAVRRTRLSEAACALPDEVIAADWWVFTRLLMDGRRGARTETPVTRYRQHAGNIQGATPSAEFEAVLRRCQIVRRHAAALPGFEARAAAVERLAQAIESDPEGMRPAILKACAEPRPWYADIAILARPFEIQANPMMLAGTQ